MHVLVKVMYFAGKGLEPITIQGGRGHWSVNYSGTKRFRNMLSNWLNKKKLVLLLNFVSLVLNYYCSNFATSNFNLLKNDFNFEQNVLSLNIPDYYHKYGQHS